MSHLQPGRQDGLLLFFSAFVIMTVHSSSQTSPWGFPEGLPCHSDQLVRHAVVPWTWMSPLQGSRKPDLVPPMWMVSLRSVTWTYTSHYTYTCTHTHELTCAHTRIHSVKANLGKPVSYHQHCCVSIKHCWHQHCCVSIKGGNMWISRWISSELSIIKEGY